MAWLLVALGAITAVALSILLAFILRHQRLHLQVELLKRVVSRAKSPWADENAMWGELSGAVQKIPSDLVEKAKGNKTGEGEE